MSYSKRQLAFFSFIGVLLLSPFTVLASVGELLYPTAGDRIAAGEMVEIKWKASTTPEKLSISLWDGQTGKWISIAAVNATQGKHHWQVPANLKGDRFRIRLEYGDQVVLSKSFFFIDSPRPTVNVKSNHGGSSKIGVQISPSVTQDASVVRINASTKLPLIVEVYDLLGNAVLRLHDTLMPSSGTLDLDLDARDLDNGTYVIRACSGSDCNSTRFVVRK